MQQAPWPSHSVSAVLYSTKFQPPTTVVYLHNTKRPHKFFVGPILWGHGGPLSRVVVVVVDIDAQAACDSSNTSWMAMRRTAACSGEWALHFSNASCISPLMLAFHYMKAVAGWFGDCYDGRLKSLSTRTGYHTYQADWTELLLHPAWQ